MSDKKHYTNRRRLLKLGIVATVGSASGCIQVGRNGSEKTPTATSEPDRNLRNAQFHFQYNSTNRQVTVQYNGGAQIYAGDLQIRMDSEKRVSWAKLGSTVTDSDSLLTPGATAVLGPKVLNWGEAVRPEQTIRLVFTGQNTPATLGRFTPPDSTDLSTTVPKTLSPTAKPTDTLTPIDSTPPLINGFSVSNSSGMTLRIAFDSTERLETIQVNISGATNATLYTDQFTETVNNGAFTYEASHTVESGGTFTLTLTKAIDANGNETSDSPSVSITVESQTPTALSDGFEDGEFSENWAKFWRESSGSLDPANDWEVVKTSALKGEYALHHKASGDPNVIATNEKIIDLEAEFTLEYKYYIPNSGNRGPLGRLIDSDSNGSKDDLVEYSDNASSLGGIRGNGGYDSGGQKFKLLKKSEDIPTESLTLGEPHTIRVTRTGDEFIGYHDDEEMIRVSAPEVDIDLSKSYRFGLRNSGTWGDASSIYFDNIQYTEQ